MKTYKIAARVVLNVEQEIEAKNSDDATTKALENLEFGRFNFIRDTLCVGETDVDYSEIVSTS